MMSEDFVYHTEKIVVLVLLSLHQEFAQYGDAAGLGLIHGCDGSHYGIFQQSATHKHFIPSFLQLSNANAGSHQTCF